MSEPPLNIAGVALAKLRAYHTPATPAPTKLDANESPRGLPEAARARLAEALAAAPLHRYPDGRATALRSALCERLGSEPDELLLGVGSDEVIQILLSAFDRPREGAAKPTVVIPSPTFVMYPITSRIQGFEPIEVPLDEDFGLDVEAMVKAIESHRPNLVFIASPNNPTGNAFDDTSLERVIEAAPDALVVIDEAYGPFAARSRNAWVERHANVGVMGTLSKVGLAGLRVGWIRMRAALVHEAEKARPPYNLCMPSQIAATLMLTELSHVIEDTVQELIGERARLGEGLRAIEGVRVLPSEANFFLIEVEDAATIRAGLLELGVQVRRFANDPRLARHLRVTVGTPEENDELVVALRTLCPATAG